MKDVSSLYPKEMKDLSTEMEKDLITAITHSLAKSLKEVKKQKKLLKLYKELMAVKDDLISWNRLGGDYFVSREKEKKLEGLIKELENNE